MNQDQQYTYQLHLQRAQRDGFKPLSPDQFKLRTFFSPAAVRMIRQREMAARVH